MNIYNPLKKKKKKNLQVLPGIKLHISNHQLRVHKFLLDPRITASLSPLFLVEVLLLDDFFFNFS